MRTVLYHIITNFWMELLSVDQIYFWNCIPVVINVEDVSSF
jgi:hypothetical protein